MEITVRYFAVLRETTGKESERVTLPAEATVESLVTQLADTYPIVARMRHATSVMVNRDYATPDRVLEPGDEVALIPPVSGGSPRFRLTPDPLDIDAVTRLVANPADGALVTFLGTVRNTARGREVVALEYEAYAEAAVLMLERVATEIAVRWGITDVAIVHRVGRLTPGEASVAIAVASPHRAEAFEACRYAIERIKQVVPIWKKEVYADGEAWIGSEAAYQAEVRASRVG